MIWHSLSIIKCYSDSSTSTPAKSSHSNRLIFFRYSQLTKSKTFILNIECKQSMDTLHLSSKVPTHHIFYDSCIAIPNYAAMSFVRALSRSCTIEKKDFVLSLDKRSRDTKVLLTEMGPYKSFSIEITYESLVVQKNLQDAVGYPTYNLFLLGKVIFDVGSNTCIVKLLIKFYSNCI